MGCLVLLRHGQSDWNAQNRFTGFVDVELSDKGRAEAEKGGRLLKDIRFDRVFASTLKRAYDTAEIALEASGNNEHLRENGEWQITKHDDLRERDYGDLAGLNKAETAEKFGDEQVHIWRRSYDVRPPGGESLKDVVERVAPYFEREILPELKAGKNILVGAHGNTVRALLVALDCHSPEEISGVEIPTGVPMVFETDNGSPKTYRFLDGK
ncbi:MAG: 2,3-bisphosphoglycerate-dependent phosphoglycerate mutase [Pseudomonadota bacterium]|uniref:2,3-bisphosphoglycerate-dependent phosphoglycerate mutase n=1 Tax=Fodinicurvata fenggangensis TaxID=1121830 RepID=UPI00047C0E5F|nr:2,3-diphosphoglycerate-dependent phosphoglycerate mutase [Fodinicurvata fenggangensis]